jgi:serine protease inhibitor
MKKLAAMVLALASIFMPPSQAASSIDLDGGTNAFGLKLFQTLAKDSADKNLLISPLSISLALTMTYNGADGTTKSAMASALGFGGQTSDDVNAEAQAVMNSLRKPGGTTRLEIANSLFGSKKVAFKAPFIDANKKYFDAEVESIDFGDPGSLGKINGWVSKKTHAKIPTILDEINPAAVLYLLNAIYFKGAWEHEFETAQTESKPFHLANGSKKDVAMMKMYRGDFSYAETPEFQAVSLPYNDKRLSLFVFLPAKNQSLASFEKTLTAANWESWMKKFHVKPGEVQLPRFKFSDDFKLAEPLSAIGMRQAFDPRGANFSKMAVVPEGPLFISQVLHKTFMEVNEEGTEAAAVTAVVMVPGSAPVAAPKPFSFVADRPFFIALHDSETNKLLFLGHIADPS